MKEIVLQVNNLTKKYGDVLALDNVSLELERGKIYGLLGPNGAGKTTLIKIIAGLIRNYQGEVKVNNEKLGINSRKVISYLSDHEFISDSWSVEYAVEFYGDFFDDFDKDKALRLINSLNIPLKKSFKSLSKGTKEKLQLVLTLSRNAELYIFDEPIAGVDPAARDLIFKLILDNYNHNGSIVISTHLISEAESVLDEYIFLKKGKVVQIGNVKKVKEEKQKSLDEIFKEEFRCLSDF